MFHVGDDVYSKRFGTGFVTDVDDDALDIYPIHVRWQNSNKRSVFTPEGQYNVHFNDPAVDICLLKGGQFKVGDHVISKHFGEGVVTCIADPEQYEYPIEVHWTGAVPGSFGSSEYFTVAGRFNYRYPRPDYDIVHKEGEEDEPKEAQGTVNDKYTYEDGEEKVGQIAGVINYEISKQEDEKMGDESVKFHVGDMVYSIFAGVGKIIKIGADKNLEYPIEVKWCNKKDCATFDSDFFTLGGNFFSDHRESWKDIVPLEEVDMEFDEEKDDDTIERKEDALNKKVEDAVNPSHYKVKGLPEAIDIINHLMKHCQFEGFLWGNILKYAYRYGRKGDKAETAGKIEWYAKHLKELCECEAEKEEGDKK